MRKNTDQNNSEHGHFIRMKWVKIKIRNQEVESQKILCIILDIEEIKISQNSHPMDKLSENFQLGTQSFSYFI